jgi:hypothetical protein
VSLDGLLDPLSGALFDVPAPDAREGPDRLDPSETSAGRFLAGQGRPEVGSQERGERFGELGSESVVFEVELHEERLVEEAPYVWPGLEVALLRMVQERERHRQVRFDLVVAGLRPAHAVVDLRESGGDAVLLAFELLERDGSGVAGLEQLRAFVDQPLPPNDDLLRLGVGGRPVGRNVGEDQLADLLAILGVETNRRVVPFDDGNERRLAGAGGCLLVASEADEVGVDHPVAVLGLGDDQAAAAAAAEDRRFQVVRALALLPPWCVGGSFAGASGRNYGNFIEDSLHSFAEGNIRYGKELKNLAKDRNFEQFGDRGVWSEPLLQHSVVPLGDAWERVGWVSLRSTL